MGLIRWLLGDTRECVAGQYFGERILPGARGMFIDPAQIPATLMEPSMEPGQPPGITESGWRCPGCGRCYAPFIACCPTCGPREGEPSHEILESGSS